MQVSITQVLYSLHIFLTLHHSHRTAAGDPHGHFCHTPRRRLDHPLHRYPEFVCSQQESGEKRDSRCMQNLPLLKSLVTWAVTAAKPKHEWTKWPPQTRSFIWVHSTHLRRDQILYEIYWAWLVYCQMLTTTENSFKKRWNKKFLNKIKSSQTNKKIPKQNLREQAYLSLTKLSFI